MHIQTSSHSMFHPCVDIFLKTILKEFQSLYPKIMKMSHILKSVSKFPIVYIYIQTKKNRSTSIV